MQSEASPSAPSEGTLLAEIRVPESPAEGALPLYVDAQGGFATYFSAFPASYWQRWTSVPSVELRVTTTGSGTVRVIASDAQGTEREAASRSVDGGTADETTFRLPLEGFDDGGWYWLELDGPALRHGGWWAPPEAAPVRRCRPTVGITTLNREEYLVPMLQSIADRPDIVEVLDRVVVIDHGSRRVADADGFDAAQAAFRGKLTLIEQANLGGSGGFSRSMLEAIDAGSDAVILLDDDVAIDPESLRRLVRFEEFSTDPVVVGGHMFDMANRARLLALSEGFRMDRFVWKTHGPSRQDVGRPGLSGTPWLHRRGDSEYNGWWMCLIPIEVLRRAGLSLPFFIKWDDAEYGLRAAEHGYATVTLPGAAIWHVSWDDKDDTVDWQAYYHARNRLVAALLHSPFPHGGKATLEELLVSVKNLFALEYGAQAIRNAAYRDVLSGPASMHETLGTRLPEVRALLASYDSGRALKHETVPVPTGPLPRGVDGLPSASPRGLGTGRLALPLGLRNLVRVRRAPDAAPQAELPFRRTKWWITGRFDSVLVATADGTSDRWLRRDRKVFLALLRDAWRLTRRIRREWPDLRAQYVAAAPELVSIERWRETTSVPAGR
jgi:galactofuranosylgalactofuranosylrhamnosyl-N-acetylglucosaminyl-diphospho-decaprenol beta-1,5/1,6-galactofuranosyltransferase